MAGYTNCRVDAVDVFRKRIHLVPADLVLKKILPVKIAFLDAIIIDHDQMSHTTAGKGHGSI